MVIDQDVDIVWLCEVVNFVMFVGCSCVFSLKEEKKVQKDVK